MRDDLDVERVGETISAKEEIAADQDRDRVAKTLCSALAEDGAFGEDRSQQPDNEKDAPASGDIFFTSGSMQEAIIGVVSPQ